MPQEVLNRPRPLARYLWKQQAAAAALLGHKPMAADADRVRLRRVDGFERSEHRDLNRDAGDFSSSDGPEPRILSRRISGAARHLLGQWPAALKRAQHAEFPLFFDRHEYTGCLGHCDLHVHRPRPHTRDPGDHSITCDREQD